jgi:hypothetical protein
VVRYIGQRFSATSLTVIPRKMPNRAQLAFVLSFISTFAFLLLGSRFLISYFQLFQTSESDSLPNAFAMAWAFSDSSIIQQNQLVALIFGILGTSVFLFFIGRSSERCCDKVAFAFTTINRAEACSRSYHMAGIPSSKEDCRVAEYCNVYSSIGIVSLPYHSS